MIEILKKIYRRTKLKSFRYAVNLLRYEEFYYGKLGLYSYKYFPKLFSKIRPKLFELEVTTHCSLRCKMCEHTYWDEPNRHVTLAQFIEIAEKFKGFVWCGLTGIGSSYMNPDFSKILRHIRKNISKDVFIELYDHFNFLDSKRSEELIDLKIDFMLISVDGSNKEVYERIRPGADFDKVVGNIKYLIEQKKLRNSFFPELAFHYIISSDNIDDVSGFVNFVSEEFGSDCCKYIYFTAILHPFDEIQKMSVEVGREIVEKAEANAKREGVKLIWNTNINPDKPPIKDCRAWIEPFIFSDGSMIPCCAGNERNNRDSQRATSLGNIFDESLDTIWASQEYSKFRKTILSGEVPVQCRHCPVRKVNGNGK